jgi:ubiquinone/menaquinone biosynthesis C-methylase UbiE
MHEAERGHSRTGTRGRVLHAAAAYDVLAWFFMLGTGERALCERLAGLARLQPGEVVLDAGCGTGTLAITAERSVGPDGRVFGVDASPEMIARATKKARRAGAEIEFRTGMAEALPYGDATFDVVLSTLMLHHLPRDLRGRFAHEIRRVLKPGGRVLVVDFGPGQPGHRKSLIGHFHRHGHVPLHDILSLLTDAGLQVVESGAVGMRDLHFALARRAADGSPAGVAERT